MPGDMDINAGRILDGTATIKEASDDAWDLMLRVASGELTRGELAGHSQVSIWRNWAIALEDDGILGKISDVEPAELVLRDTDAPGEATATLSDGGGDARRVVISPPLSRFVGEATTRVAKRVNLVLPTSLECPIGLD